MDHQAPIPNPGAWNTGPEQQEQEHQDQQTPAPSLLADTDIDTIRSIFPNLKNLSDSFISSTPMQVLLQMNQQAQQAPEQSDMQASMLAAAAAAVQYSQMAGFNPTAQDPGVKMAKNLEKLKSNPVTIPEGQDDRVSILHCARFLRRSHLRHGSMANGSQGHRTGGTDTSRKLRSCLHGFGWQCHPQLGRLASSLWRMTTGLCQ